VRTGAVNAGFLQQRRLFAAALNRRAVRQNQAPRLPD
jgi:hypothetical protein